MTTDVRRSWLVTAAHVPAAWEAAAGSGADVVVLDATDPEAAGLVGTGISEAIDACTAGGSEVFIAVNGDQLDPSADPLIARTSGLVLRAPSGPDEVVEADAALTRAGGPLELVVALESATANESAYEIVTASRRVTTMTLGQADLGMDLRAEPSGEIHLLAFLLQRMVTIAGATGREPIGAWWRSPARGCAAGHDDTLAAALRGRASGCVGAWCASASQVAALHEAFGERPRS